MPGLPYNHPSMSTHPNATDRVTRVETQLQTLPTGGATLAYRFHQNVMLNSY